MRELARVRLVSHRREGGDHGASVMHVACDRAQPGSAAGDDDRQRFVAHVWLHSQIYSSGIAT